MQNFYKWINDATQHKDCFENIQFILCEDIVFNFFCKKMEVIQFNSLPLKSFEFIKKKFIEKNRAKGTIVDLSPIPKRKMARIERHRPT